MFSIENYGTPYLRAATAPRFEKHYSCVYRAVRKAVACQMAAVFRIPSHVKGSSLAYAEPCGWSGRKRSQRKAMEESSVVSSDAVFVRLGQSLGNGSAHYRALPYNEVGRCGRRNTGRLLQVPQHGTLTADVAMRDARVCVRACRAFDGARRGTAHGGGSALRCLRGVVQSHSRLHLPED